MFKYFKLLNVCVFVCICMNIKQQKWNKCGLSLLPYVRTVDKIQ